LDDSENKVHATLFNQLELLNTCLLSSMTEVDVDSEEEQMQAPNSPEVVRSTSENLVSLSGGDNMAYLEYSRGTTSGLARKRKP
jgi:DNA excision repair protein ERCC-3